MKEPIKWSKGERSGGGKFDAATQGLIKKKRIAIWLRYW
jgi:hypothetical protein